MMMRPKTRLEEIVEEIEDEEEGLPKKDILNRENLNGLNAQDEQDDEPDWMKHNDARRIQLRPTPYQF